jgi:mono/diheme cytochrome c family protein/glucose/arabinose dehydrogenase
MQCICLSLFALFFSQTPLAAQPEDAEPDEKRPGLIAAYKSLIDREAQWMRVEAKPAFMLGHGSPHPRLPAGPFTVVWTGLLWVQESGPLRFDAIVGGAITLDVDGVRVLEGRTTSDTTRVKGAKTFTRPLGAYPFKLQFTSVPDVPARLQLWWEGPTFWAEAVPAWRFHHLPAQRPQGLAAEEDVQVGKTLALRLGCARCHGGALPGIEEPAPGPGLGDLRGRVSRAWLIRWLANPTDVHSDARMPAVFAQDRAGFVERWLVADYLAGKAAPPSEPGEGNHRLGRQTFFRLGCLACHLSPEQGSEEQAGLNRSALRGLGDRHTAESLARFLVNPRERYPDGRMPRLPLTLAQARDLAAFLLLWSPSTNGALEDPPMAQEIDAVQKRLRVRDLGAAASALIREKRCGQCHGDLHTGAQVDVPIAAWKASSGCLSGTTLPRFSLAASEVRSLIAYGKVGSREKYPSPFAFRQRRLEVAGCARCHQRDSDRPAPLEAASSVAAGAFLQTVPFQRTPRLTYPHQKFTRQYLATTVRDGSAGIRHESYSFRMPAFGPDAEVLVQALAEADGELPAGPESGVPPPADPTAAPLLGPQLAGFRGYGCVSCHVWKGQKLNEPDPGAVGTELTRVAGRIRRDWFERFLDDPARFHPGTPMPAIFTKGKPALLTAVLEADAAKQKDVLWHYFALGLSAPSPKPPPPLAVAVPAKGPLVAQVPMHWPGGLMECLALFSGERDLVLYDLEAGAVKQVYVGAHVTRQVQGRLRTFTAEGTAVPWRNAGAPLQLVGGRTPEPPAARTFLGYERLDDGVRLRWRIRFSAADIGLTETLRLASSPRRLVLESTATGIPPGRELAQSAFGQATRGAGARTLTLVLPAAPAPAVANDVTPPPLASPPEQGLARPGYRARAYPRPKTGNGDDRVMPVAVAVHPKDGRVFAASMKMGEIFVVRDPARLTAQLDDYAHGLFQEAYSLCAEEDGLYVLHRRNLSRLSEKPGTGRAERCERIALLPHGKGDTYDYGYGLVRDRSGAFVYSFAPHANRDLPGSGGALRLVPGHAPAEIAYGFRNPIGWCTGPDGEVFFTDNQGEWVPTNKLCHLVPGRYYGYPNSAQKQHATKPAGQAAVWVPYGWARSINGVAYDSTQGKFGPFAGQFFLAELMYGGALVRAQLEKVNGQYQGACFPFWGKGLLGPVALAFDPVRGPLYVGSITEPGWMAQPDRGALYRLEYTGEVPFEIQSIHVRPRGFRLVFTRPVDPETARQASSYLVEHFRYEISGAYGSPELDRTAVKLERAHVAADGQAVELTTSPLVPQRVYMIDARGIRARDGAPLVHTTGAYTLNEIPGR